MKYIPKNLKSNSIYKPESRLLKEGLNTIGSLKIYNGLREDFKLTENDKKWLESRIDHIATELYLEGKRILVSAVGGYSGCPDKMIDTIRLNNIQITNLKFCYTCTDSYRDKNFIEIFNNRMYSLMDIEPPNRKTKSFYGEFKGRSKGKLELRLVLKNDRSFKYWLNKEHGDEYTEGLWENKNETLILNSKTLNQSDSLIYTLSSGKWVEFKNLKFCLKKEKLTELKNGKRKLKKTVE